MARDSGPGMGSAQGERACSEGSGGTCKCAVSCVGALAFRTAVACVDTFARDDWAYGRDRAHGHNHAYGYDNPHGHDGPYRYHGAHRHHGAHRYHGPHWHDHTHGYDDAHQHHDAHGYDDAYGCSGPCGAGSERISEGWRAREHTSERIGAVHRPGRHAH